MATTYIIYPSGNDLYSKASLTADPWGSDAVDLVSVSGNLYSLDDSNPYVFLGEASSAADTDTQLGTVGDFYYGTVLGGDVFFAKRIHNWDWTNATTEEKVRALYNASQLIDKFSFIGCKVESSQSLEFPRQLDGVAGSIHNGDIPPPIIEACYLIADSLLSGRDPQSDFEALMTKVETFGPIRTEFERARGPQEHLANLIPSPDAWQRIKPFLYIATGFSTNLG